MEKLLANLIIEKVHSVTKIYNEKGAEAKRDSRRCFAIVIKYEGETVYLSGGRAIVSNKDNIVILPKDSKYEWKCTQSGHYISLEFDSTASFTDIISLHIENSDEILKILNKLEYKRLIKKPMYQAESIRDAYTVILKLAENLERKYVPEEKAEKLRPASEYMTEHYTESLSNDFLASLTGLSNVYFRRLFKDIYGVAPMEYLKNLRIKKAKEMLRSDHGSITDIAVSLGYPSIYDFSRDFKKHVGISPSKFTK